MFQQKCASSLLKKKKRIKKGKILEIVYNLIFLFPYLVSSVIVDPADQSNGTFLALTAPKTMHLNVPFEPKIVFRILDFIA